jgi:hypothetical protein
MRLGGARGAHSRFHSPTAGSPRQAGGAVLKQQPRAKKYPAVLAAGRDLKE